MTQHAQALGRVVRGVGQQTQRVDDHDHRRAFVEQYRGADVHAAHTEAGVGLELQCHVFGEHDVAGRHTRGDRVEQRADHPGPRGGGDLGGGVITRHRAAVQQRPAGGFGQRPTTHRPRDHRHVGAPAVGGLLPGPFDAVGQVGVRVGEQHREQLVAPGDIAVHRRRHHAEVTGDGPDGQTGGALGRQLPAAQRDDLRLDALPRLLALAHPASVTQTENTALDFPATRWHSGFRERCSHF